MSFQHKTKRILAAALVVWMSGIVVLFCCEMPTANAADVEIESCPLAKKGNCAKTSAKTSEHSFNREPLSFDCCTFPAKIFDKARKLENAPQSPIIAESIEIAAPKFFGKQKTFKFSGFYQSFVRNRGSTYLRNRVFRI